uniref:Pnpla6_0 protein n=1 Tax=Fopius arisanus TaxID=64838 RepID=A0A0C9R6N1_9HYME
MSEKMSDDYSKRDEKLIKKIHDIRRTLCLLDSSVKISQSLQVEQSFKVLNMKIKNLRLQKNLQDAANKNNTMLSKKSIKSQLRIKKIFPFPQIYSARISRVMNSLII